MDFSYLIEDYEFFKLLKLNGNLTVVSSEIFERVISNLTHDTNIVLDMSEIKILTSAGINSLVNVSLFAKKNGKRVMILNFSKENYELAMTLNFLDYLIIIETLEEGKVKIKYYT